MAFSQSPNALVNRFQCVCYKYLKLQERERLTYTLRCFERSHDVVELIETMASICDTSEKRAAIYPVVHELLPVSCRKSYQDMLHRKLSPEENIHSPKMMHRSFSSLPSDDSSVLNNSPESSNTINIQKVIHIQQSTKDGTNLGFRLCYCEISGPGFFINSMEPEFAEWSGFEIGDELVAVNDISVHNWQMNADQLLNVVAIQSQQRTGVDIQIQRLMFSPQKLTTDGPCVLQYVYWYDIVNMTFHRKHTPKCPSQLRHTRMKMHDSTTGRMGLNIRGGREFMCGIYISKIERDGLADRCGLRVGDQILTVNGLNLIDIPYREACRQMAYEDTLDFVVRYTGQFPIFTDTPQNRPSSRKEKGHHLLSDTSPYRTPTRNYPYSNGRVDPIGSCSPGTIHSYKISDPTDDVYYLKKGVYSDGTSHIYNPLCSDDSSLLSYLPNSPSSEPTSANDMEYRRRTENIQSRTDEPPIPPPRTGKPNLEKLNQIMGKKNNAIAKPHQSSRVVAQEDICSQFSKVEVETIAIVHQPVNDPPKHERLKDDDSVKPNGEGKVIISKPPRKHKKKTGINNMYDDEKAKAEIETGKEETAKPELQNDITILKSENKILNLKPQSIQPIEEFKQIEQIEPVKLEYSAKMPDITIESVDATKSGNNLKPCIEIEPVQFIKPEVTVKPIDNPVNFIKPEVTVKPIDNPVNFIKPEVTVKPIDNPVNFIKPEVTVKPIDNPVNFIKPESSIEPELLSIHRANSPMHDDDDRFSYISSVSMEYDGENFIMKWPLSEDEATYSNDIHEEEQNEIRWLDSTISNAHVDKHLAENTPDSATEPVSLPLENLSAGSEVPPVTTTPVATTASSLPSSLPSAQNVMERGNYSRAKRRTEDGRFQNSVVRVMNNNLTTSEENSENNPYEMLKKMANVILTREEIRNVMQYISEYREQNDVERLVSRLLEILNNPEKHLLLNQIRELVSPFDRGRFDSMLSFYENQHFTKKLDYKDIFTGNGERGMRSGLKEEQSILARVQCRRKQLDAQMELLESLKQIKPKMYTHKEEDLNLITVYVSKNIRTLGISVTGGADCKRQQEIMIEEVHAGGAAAETKRIKPGMSLVSVDDEDIEAVSHRAGVYAIRRAFTDRKKPYMKLVLRKQAETERWPTS